MLNCGLGEQGASWRALFVRSWISFYHFSYCVYNNSSSHLQVQPQCEVEARVAHLQNNYSPWLGWKKFTRLWSTGVYHGRQTTTSCQGDARHPQPPSNCGLLSSRSIMTDSPGWHPLPPLLFHFFWTGKNRRLLARELLCHMQLNFLLWTWTEYED